VPSFVDVVAGASALASDVQQIVDALKGSSGKGVPISLTALNDAVNFALAVRNNDAGASKAAAFYKADGTVLLQVDKNGVSASADGVATSAPVATTTATQTLSSKTLASPAVTGDMINASGRIAAWEFALPGYQIALKLAVLPSVANGSIGNRLFNNQTADLIGLLVVVANGGPVGVFNVSNGSVTIMSDPANVFGITSGVGVKHNIYWNSGNARVELSNNSGSAASYYLAGLGL
jgi:hypothetical protein